MGPWMRLSMVIGYLLLTLGVAAYIRLALTGKGSVLFCFACCMSCLLFFNLPTVVARRKQRKEAARTGELPRDSL
ncbi:MAG: hypothetical protein QNK37_35065 [Acidobacteriota bacterium]|nr:hypothetical protein [Acidobacteriota bacterium]